MLTGGQGRILRLASGSAVLVAYDEGTPSSEEWQAWLAEYRRRIDELSAVLIYSLGGWPNSSQRSMLLNVMEASSSLHKTAVVTPSKVIRDVATAFNWFMRRDAQSAVFSPDKFDAACDYLELDTGTRFLFEETIDRHVRDCSVRAD